MQSPHSLACRRLCTESAERKAPVPDGKGVKNKIGPAIQPSSAQGLIYENILLCRKFRCATIPLMSTLNTTFSKLVLAGVLAGSGGAMAQATDQPAPPSTNPADICEKVAKGDSQDTCRALANVVSALKAGNSKMAAESFPKPALAEPKRP
ncbi:MAG: hypothetical protein JWO78_2131 [Micavibrio sp.]|nr:hypothetical protein [Micavibrio sp.]